VTSLPSNHTHHWYGAIATRIYDIGNTKFDRTSTGEPQMALRSEISGVVTFLLISAPSQVREKKGETRLRVNQNCSVEKCGTHISLHLSVVSYAIQLLHLREIKGMKFFS
jgi:hypothetical protein